VQPAQPVPLAALAAARFEVAFEPSATPPPA